MYIQMKGCSALSRCMHSTITVALLASSFETTVNGLESFSFFARAAATAEESLPLTMKSANFSVDSFSFFACAKVAFGIAKAASRKITTLRTERIGFLPEIYAGTGRDDWVRRRGHSSVAVQQVSSLA